MYKGDFTTANTIYHLFNTFSSDDPSASITLTGFATSDIKIYKDGSITQRTSTAGFTLLDTDGIDFDSITGIHGFSIDLSDNTDSGFYAAGSEYIVVINAVTVDGATINFVAFSFSIERANGVLARLKANTASEDVEYRIIAKGSESQSIEFVVRKTDGSPYTGLAYNTSGLSCYSYIQDDSGASEVSLVTTTLGTWDSGSFVKVSDTNTPGLVSLGIPDALLADTEGVDRVTIVLKGASAMKQKTIHIDLVSTISAETGTGFVGLSTAALGNIDTTIDANSSVVAILADTNELQADDYPTSIAAVQSAVDAVQGDVTDVLEDTGTTLPSTLGTIAGYIDTEVGTIASGVSTIDGKIDTAQGNITDILEDTSTTLPGLISSASVPQLLVSTTIATLASQTSFTLTAGSADDNAYKGCMIIVTDQSTSTQKAIGMCSAYTGSSKTITLGVDPGIFTMATGDTVDVVAVDSNTRYINSARVTGDGNGTTWRGA